MYPPSLNFLSEYSNNRLIMIADYRKNGSNSKYASKVIAMAEVQRKYEEMIKIRKQIPFIKRIFHKSVSKMVSDFYKKNND